MSGKKISLIAIVGVGLAVLGGYFYWRQLSDPPPEDLFQSGLISLEAGDYETVRKTVKKLRGESGFEKERELLQVGLLVRTGKSAYALERLKSLPPEGEYAPLIYQFAGEALYQENQLPPALFCMKKLLELEPENEEAHRWLAAIYYDLGSLHLALVHIDQVVKLAPEDYRPFRLRAVIQTDFEQYSAAIDDYRRALELELPKKLVPAVKMEFANALLKQKKHGDVLELLKDEDSTAEVWLTRSIAYRGMGKLRNARNALTEAEKLDPDNPLVWKQSALLHVDQNEPAQAKKLFDGYLLQNPHDVEILYQQALVEKGLGNDAESVKLMQRKNNSQKLFEEMTALSKKILNDTRDVRSRQRLAEICDQLGRSKMAAVWRNAAKASGALVQQGEEAVLQKRPAP